MSDEDMTCFLQRISWFERTDQPPMVSSPMYERFTDRSRKVMQLAQQECDRLNHEYVGTEHILIGLLKEGSGVAANVLKNLDMDLNKIRQEVEKIMVPGPDERPSGLTALAKKPITPRGKKVLEYAIEAARTLVHNYVGTEHLLLGLLRVEEGVACQVLNNLGCKLDEVREEVLNILGHPLSGTEKGVEKDETPKEKVAEWKLEVKVPASTKMILAEIERIVNSETDPAKVVAEIKKLFGK